MNPTDALAEGRAMSLDPEVIQAIREDAKKAYDRSEAAVEMDPQELMLLCDMASAPSAAERTEKLEDAIHKAINALEAGDAKEAKRGLLYTLMDGQCPPCDMGENTECVCPPKLKPSADIIGCTYCPACVESMEQGPDLSNTSFDDQAGNPDREP